MNILLVASEVVPYAKTGGLADVAGALPKALARLGHNVRVVMPRYKLEKIEACTERLADELVVPFNFEERRVGVFVDRSREVPVYFIDAPEYFHRAKLYGDSDDIERFGFFSRAVLEFAKALGERFDVIHLRGKFVVPLVREHLDLCPECCEEYEALLDVLEKTSSDQK